MHRKQSSFLLLSWGVVFAFLLSVGRAWTGLVMSAGTCPPVQNTPYFTIAYGTVTLDGAAAPVGAVVEAVSPRADVVGCFVVQTAGNYGAMYVYGEDTTVSPPIPGMRNGETIALRVNSAAATATPNLVWSNDHDVHQVDLVGSGTVSCDLAGNDGLITVEDIQEEAGRWRDEVGQPYDRDSDNRVTVADIMWYASRWGEPCS